MSQNQREAQSNWPQGVNPITFDSMEHLGLDGKNNLYWDGNRIEVRKRLDLRWWQVALAIMAALGALASDIVDVTRLCLDVLHIL